MLHKNNKEAGRTVKIDEACRGIKEIVKAAGLAYYKAGHRPAGRYIPLRNPM